MDKTVKISATVDTSSFDVAKRKLTEILNVQKEILTVSKELSQLGGLGGMVTGGGRTAAPGTGKVKPAAQQTQIGFAGVDGLTKSTQAFKAASQAAKDSLKTMSGAFRDTVDSSSRDGKRLLKEMADLERGFDRLAARAIKLRGSAGGDGLTSSEAASIRSPMGRFMDMARKPIPGTPELPGSQGYKGPGAGLLRAFGVKGGALTAGLGGAAAIVAGANWVSEQRLQNQMGNLDFSMAQPFLRVDRQAKLGQIFGGNALAMKQGDLARSMAMSGMVKDKDFQKLMGNQREDFWRGLINKQNPGSSFDSWGSNATVGNAYRIMKEKVGSAGAGAGDWFAKFMTGTEELPGLSKTEIGNLRNQLAKEALVTKAPEEINRYLEAKIAANPVQNALVNEIYGGALGSAGMARGLRTSGGVIKVRNKQGQIIYEGDSLKYREGRATKAGYSTGEEAGMIGQIGAQGYGLGTGAAFRLLSATHGGLVNAASLYGLGAQFGGGTAAGAGGYFGAIQSMFGGRRGTDVTAASHLLGTAQSAMTGGNFTGFGPGAGLGFMQTLMDAGMTGTPGGDMVRSRQVIGGLGLMGTKMAGGIDPLQQALNYSAALQADPNLGITGASALMDADPATRMEILRTGKVPEWMRASGVDADTFKKYVNAQTSTDLARFMEDKPTEIGAAVGRFRTAGGISSLAGLSGKDLVSEIEKLARGHQRTTKGKLEDSMGMFFNQASEAGYFPKSSGKGARQTFSKDTVYGVSLDAQGNIMMSDGTTIGKNEAGYKQAAATLPENVKASERAREQGQSGAGVEKVEDAAGRVANALMGLVNALKAASPDPGPRRAAAPQPR